MVNSKGKQRFRQHGIDLIFGAMIHLILALSVLFFAFPLLHVFILSVSDPAAVASGGLILWPRGIHFDAYRIVMENRNIMTGLVNTLLYILSGVSIQYLVTVLAAYALSIAGLPGKRFLWAFFLIPMYFSGGVIPTYLLISKLRMLNTVWAVVLPGAVNISFIIIMRTQFMNVPQSLKDAAEIDGAKDLTLLFRVLLPLSAATGAVILLFGTVTFWNMWYEPMIYTTRRSMYPLQLVLREILIDNSVTAVSGRARAGVMLTRKADRGAVQLMVKYAVIVLTTLPMLALYPFVRRHFVKGMMIGSIKG